MPVTARKLSRVRDGNSFSAEPSPRHTKTAGCRPGTLANISQFLERQSDYEFAVDNGSLYPALQRLLQRRWITSQWKTSPNGRRAKYYRLTPLGRRQLLAEKSKWMRFVDAMSRVLAPER